MLKFAKNLELRSLNLRANKFGDQVKSIFFKYFINPVYLLKFS